VPIAAKADVIVMTLLVSLLPIVQVITRSRCDPRIIRDTWLSDGQAA
jgi:hypothetical protein